MARRSNKTKKTSSRAWSYSAGEWGKTRVRVFERGTKSIYAEFWEETITGRRKRRVGLGTRDREVAKAKADALALEFRTQVKVDGPVLTWTTLFDIYERSIMPSKAPTTQKRDRVRLAMFLQYFGAQRHPKTLSLQEWNRFITDRRKGIVTPEGSPARKRKISVKEPTLPQPVRNRAIEADLRLLLAVLNFATVASDGMGNPLLDRNPCKGFPVPKEDNPKRPILTADEYAALLKVAPKVHPSLTMALILAHETGHRGASLRQLRWGDIDLEEKRIRWRAETDKMHFEHITPLTDEAVRALAAHQKAQAAIGDCWVFPSPIDPTKPCPRERLSYWWERAVTLAKLPVIKGRGFHSIRRQFATELKHMNLKDLAAIGGWKTSATLLACYITPDEETQREGLATRKPFRAAAQS